LCFTKRHAILERLPDGIESGGKRLAAEVEEEIKKIDGPIRLSFVANSLGGLYVRYAIAHINITEKITPLVYCTTSTPHLGCCNHTYITMPRWAESTIGNMLAQTGRDLFCDTPIVKELGTSDMYLDALRKFKQRVAIANAFATDILVPVTTAAFLSTNSDYLHTTLPGMKQYLLAVQTEPVQEFDKQDASQCLDSLGWIKLFLDMRGKMPLPSIPLPFRRPTTIPDQPAWTSRELFPILSRVGSRSEIPLGHTVSIANSRNKFCTIIAEKGKPVMDQVAKDLLMLMGVPLSITSSTEETGDRAVARTFAAGVPNEDINHVEMAIESSQGEAAVSSAQTNFVWAKCPSAIQSSYQTLTKTSASALTLLLPKKQKHVAVTKKANSRNGNRHKATLDVLPLYPCVGNPIDSGLDRISVPYRRISVSNNALMCN
jgi:hypothetical protein